MDSPYQMPETGWSDDLFGGDFGNYDWNQFDFSLEPLSQSNLQYSTTFQSTSYELSVNNPAGWPLEDSALGDSAALEPFNQGWDLDHAGYPEFPDMGQQLNMRTSPGTDMFSPSSSSTATMAVTTDRPFHCQEEGCIKSFAKKEGLKQHLREVHYKKFKCDICGRMFGSSKARKRHVFSQHREEREGLPEGDNQARCDFPGCTRVCRKDNLKRHKRIHRN